MRLPRHRATSKQRAERDESKSTAAGPGIEVARSAFHYVRPFWLATAQLKHLRDAIVPPSETMRQTKRHGTETTIAKRKVTMHKIYEVVDVLREALQ